MLKADEYIALHFYTLYVICLICSWIRSKIAWDESTMNCRCPNSPWCDFEWNTRGWYSQLDRGIGRLTREQLQLPKSSWCILGTTFHQDDWWFRGIWRNSDPIKIPETSGYFGTPDLPKNIRWAMAKGLLSSFFDRRSLRSFHFLIWVLQTMASQLRNIRLDTRHFWRIWMYLAHLARLSLAPRFDTISASTFGNQFVGRVANPDEAWKKGSLGAWDMNQANMPSNIFKAFKPTWFWDCFKILHFN